MPFPAIRDEATPTSNREAVEDRVIPVPNQGRAQVEAFSASQLMTIEALGKYLDVSTSVLYRLVKSGRLPAEKIGRQWRLNLMQVQDYLADAYENKICINKRRSVRIQNRHTR
jgi:excisionase family DNA binding protein